MDEAFEFCLHQLFWLPVKAMNMSVLLRSKESIVVLFQREGLTSR